MPSLLSLLSFFFFFFFFFSVFIENDAYISFIYYHAVVHISGFLMKFGTNQSHTTVYVFLVPSSLIFMS
jgi:hypothetical protein